MADLVYMHKDKWTDHLDAIRAKAGTSDTMTVDEATTAVEGISGGTDTSDATLNSGGQMLSGVTAYSQGTKYTGTIPTQAAATITPTESAQTAVSAGKYTAGDVTVGAIPSDYIGTDIPRRSSISVSQDNNTIHVEDGYYEDDIDTSMGACTVTGASVSIDSQGDATGSIIVGRGGYITSGSHAFYVDDVVTPRSSSDLTASGATVSVPYGYYPADASKTVASGSAGTPTATKGSVSNHTVNVTPSVTNTTGYITGGTKTGTAVSVSASELDSGTKSITANGNGQDVIGYAAVDVAVPNSYSASDEGKVVSSGALVSQTSDTVTANDTYDTTLINSLTVNVSGGGGGTQIGIETPKANLLSMIYALEQGTAKTGTFTLSTTLPNTATTIFDANDTTVTNFVIMAENVQATNTGTTNAATFAMNLFWIQSQTLRQIFSSPLNNRQDNVGNYLSVANNKDISITSSSNAYISAYWDWSNGVLSVKAQYNKHTTYTPFASGVTYRWVAW